MMTDARTPGPFDEEAFCASYRKTAPDPRTVRAFRAAAKVSPALALRTMNRLRGDASGSPAAVLAMFALGISALSFFVNLLLAIIGAKSVSGDGIWFWLGEAAAIIVLALLGVSLFVVTSRRHRAATLWRDAFEDALK